MANYNPQIRGQEYIFYISLASQSNPNVFQSNPTLASGDVKISKDGAAEANLNTLPTVTPASGKRVKVTVSATEMDADNISIIFSDASGAEWCDIQCNLQPAGIGIPGLVNGGTPSTTVFRTTLTQVDDFHNSSYILFTDGALQGQSRKISDFANTNGEITVATAFTSAPADQDPFIIIGRSE